MKKHILIVSQYFYPEQFRINDIALEWKNRGYKVTVLTGIPNYPQGKFYSGYGLKKKRREQWNGIEIIRIPLIARGKSATQLAFNYLSFVVSGYFWKCVTDVKADMVFTFEVSPMTQALISVWYAKKHKVPHYLYVQDLWPENVETATGIRSKAIIAPINKMVNYIYKHSDRIFVTSPSFVNAVQKRISDNKHKVSYWPQYAEDFYQPNQEKSVLIPQNGIFNITFTGNIGTAQGLDTLPLCAKRLKEKGKIVRFNIVGEGRNKDNLINFVKKCRVEDYFNFIDWQPVTDIPKILAASDVAYLSFANNLLYSYTIPAKLQSYMACGMPILAAACGETQRIIEAAECGLCCAVGDDEALCDLIIKIMSINLSQMSFRSRLFYEKHFQKNQLMDEMDHYLCG